MMMDNSSMYMLCYELCGIYFPHTTTPGKMYFIIIFHRKTTTVQNIRHFNYKHR